MKITINQKKDYHIIKIEGPIKALNEFDLAEQIEPLFDTSAAKFIIDLKKVPFINSATLGIFLNIHKRTESMNGRFSICSVNREVEKLMEITKLTNILDIYKNLDEAIESYED